MSLFRPRPAEGQRIDLGGCIVRLKVNPRSKRIILRVDPSAREGVAVAPSPRMLPEALAFAKARRAWLADRLARLPALGEAPRVAATGERRREALGDFTVRVKAHCATLGTAAPRISVTDTRSRWGSCAPARAGRPAWIRLSWRLMLAPDAVRDYVVAHECAHLIEANHGPGFWRVVRRLIGDEAPHRAWLREHGAKLHQM